MKGTTLKLSDIQKSAQKSNPHFQVDFEINEEDGSTSERSVLLYNILRTREEDRPAIAKEFKQITEDKANAAEKKLKESARRVMSGRIAKALRAVADDKDVFDELLDVLDKNSTEYDITMDQLFISYTEETSLGEALASPNS